MTAGAFDTKSVDTWLTDHMAGYVGPSRAEKIQVGQSNPTFRLITPDARYVLRRKPDGVLLKSAHAVDREFRVQRALAATEVPVAHMHILCEDDSVIGAAFYIMAEVNGRNFDDPRMLDVSHDQRGDIFSEMCRVLTAIHEVDLTATELDDYGPDGNYYGRQIGRWTKQYRASETETIPAMEDLIDWLDRSIPNDDGQRTLVHGDFRIDNMLFAHNSADCLAMLDWELSTTGHPYADLAAVIMQWNMPVGPDSRGLEGVDRNANGLWSDQQFIDSYCACRGIAGIDRFGFYLAFSYFRMAAILQGVLKRGLDGNASDPERAAKLGAYVPMFAEAGLRAAG